MNENEKVMTEAESLSIISGMINHAKNRFSENGHLYLLWGWLVFICSLAHFICIKFQLLQHPEIVWAATWLAVIYQVIFLSKQKKKEKVKTYADEIVGYVWLAFAIMMFITIFLMSKNSAFEKMYPMFLVLYGMPTFLCGIIFRFPALKFGGLCCWALAIVAAFVNWDYQLLLLALAVFTAWIIPGYLLREKFKKEN
jgi:uncharacterized membrane protein